MKYKVYTANNTGVDITVAILAVDIEQGENPSHYFLGSPEVEYNGEIDIMADAGTDSLLPDYFTLTRAP